MRACYLEYEHDMTFDQNLYSNFLNSFYFIFNLIKLFITKQYFKLKNYIKIILYLIFTNKIQKRSY